MLKTRVVSNANRRSTRNVFRSECVKCQQKIHDFTKCSFCLINNIKNQCLFNALLIFADACKCYEILKFFMHVSLLCILEDFLPEKSANYMLS